MSEFGNRFGLIYTFAGEEHIAWEVRKSIDSKVPKKKGICRIC